MAVERAFQPDLHKTVEFSNSRKHFDYYLKKADRTVAGFETYVYDAVSHAGERVDTTLTNIIGQEYVTKAQKYEPLIDMLLTIGIQTKIPDVVVLVLVVRDMINT